MSEIHPPTIHTPYMRLALRLYGAGLANCPNDEQLAETCLDVAKELILANRASLKPGADVGAILQRADELLAPFAAYSGFRHHGQGLLIVFGESDSLPVPL